LTKNPECPLIPSREGISGATGVNSTLQNYDRYLKSDRASQKVLAMHGDFTQSFQRDLGCRETLVVSIPALEREGKQ
jgi:hypothetical protein